MTDLGAKAFNSAPMAAKASGQGTRTYLSLTESQRIGSVRRPTSSNWRSDQLSSSVTVCSAKNSGGHLLSVISHAVAFAPFSQNSNALRCGGRP
jgi:hypothetical protein